MSPKLRMGKSNKKMYRCVNGPWHSYFAKLPPETIVFTIKEFTGKYVEGVWRTIDRSATVE